MGRDNLGQHNDNQTANNEDTYPREASCDGVEVIIDDNQDPVPEGVAEGVAEGVPGPSASADVRNHASLHRSMSLPAALRMNLSFCGCGFLGIYHLGVASALAKHGSSLLLNVQRFCGASAGALVASALAVKGSDEQVLEECRTFCMKLATDTSRRRLGVLSPGESLLRPLENFLRRLMPPDAHLIASGRLFISVTEVRSRKNYMVSEFASRDELIQYLLGSSYIPFITSNRPVLINSRRYTDGGMTNNLPSLPDGRTILVSPFSGKQDICPTDRLGRGLFMCINQQDFQVNVNNAKRGLHALFPPSVKHLESYYKSGQKDAIRFLKKEGMYNSGNQSNDSMSDVGVASSHYTLTDNIQFESIV